MRRITETGGKRAFQKGWNAVPQGRAKKVRGDIMSALEISALQTFRQRMDGRTYNNPAEVEKIEKIFHREGITNIWGKVRKSQKTQIVVEEQEEV